MTLCYENFSGYKCCHPLSTKIPHILYFHLRLQCPQLLFHGKELPIFTCVKTKNTTVLESLLRATMPLLTSPSHDELSSAAMHFGSKQEQLWLEQRRQEAVVEGILIDHNQRTLLHTAVITNNVKVVTLLLKVGNGNYLKDQYEVNSGMT